MAMGRRYRFLPLTNFVKHKKNRQAKGMINGGWDSHLDITMAPKEKVKIIDAKIPTVLENNSFPKR